MSPRSAQWVIRIGRHQTPDGSVIVPPRIAAWLEDQAAVTSDKRILIRGTDPAAYEVLMALHQAALEYGSAAGTKTTAQQEKSRQYSSWLTTTEVGERLGVSGRAIRKRISAGQLPAIKYGGRWLVNHRQLHTVQTLD